MNTAAHVVIQTQMSPSPLAPTPVLVARVIQAQTAMMTSTSAILVIGLVRMAPAGMKEIALTRLTPVQSLQMNLLVHALTVGLVNYVEKQICAN